MKKLLSGAVAVAAMAAPAAAFAQDGYIDLSYTGSEISAGGVSEDFDRFQVGGAAAFNSGGIGVQLNGHVAELEADFGGDATVYGGDGHIFGQSGSWLFGASVGAEHFDEVDVTEWGAAAQAHYRFERVTLVGAVSYSDVEDGDATFWGVDGEARFFQSDNFRFSGNFGWGQVEIVGVEADLWRGGVEGEYKFGSAPISMFAGYQHRQVNDGDADIDAFSVGLRYNWGGTLLERDRSGATMERPGGVLSFLLL